MPTRKSRWIAAAAMAGIALIGLVAIGLGGARYGGAINALKVDLARPDAYLATAALSKLPRDVIRAPLLREVLTEDLVFYYDTHEDRLSLRGALRRLAFEHELTLSDTLLAAALDEPAEVALWVDAKGAPRHFMVAMHRGVLVRALEQVVQATRVAQGQGKAADRQFGTIGSFRVNFREVTVTALSLSSRRTLAFASLGDRLVVLSDPGLLFDTDRHIDGAARDVVAALLSDDPAKRSLHRRAFGLPGTEVPATGHTLVLDARLVSFGYQHFFPAIAAVQLSLTENGAQLRTAVRLNGPGPLPVDGALWRALPFGAAACVAVPVDWTRLQPVLDAAARSGADAGVGTAKATKVGTASPETSAATDTAAATPHHAHNKASEGGSAVKPSVAVASLATRLQGPVAACWYAEAQLHTPLFVAQLGEAATPASDVGAADALLDWLLPVHTGKVDAADQTALPVNAMLWQRRVKAPWGRHEDDDGKPAYRLALGQLGRIVSFSPDDALVTTALRTQARAYPSMADALSSPIASASAAAGSAPARTTLAQVSPARLADLLTREAFAVLGPEQAAMRQAAQTHLLPRLAALRRLPDAHAEIADAPDAQGWVDVQWVPHGSAATIKVPR